MAKILNLDTFEQPNDKQVVLNGKTHEFRPFTVEEFIAQVKEIEDIEKEGDVSVSKYAEFSMKTILRAFPTIKPEELQALTVAQLRALSDFVKSVAEDEAAAGAASVDAPGKTEGEAN